MQLTPGLTSGSPELFPLPEPKPRNYEVDKPTITPMEFTIDKVVPQRDSSLESKPVIAAAIEPIEKVMAVDTSKLTQAQVAYYRKQVLPSFGYDPAKPSSEAAAWRNYGNTIAQKAGGINNAEVKSEEQLAALGFSRPHEASVALKAGVFNSTAKLEQSSSVGTVQNLVPNSTGSIPLSDRISPVSSASAESSIETDKK